jgi:hypothetical protein
MGLIPVATVLGYDLIVVSVVMLAFHCVHIVSGLQALPLDACPNLWIIPT